MTSSRSSTSRRPFLPWLLALVLVGAAAWWLGRSTAPVPEPTPLALVTPSVDPETPPDFARPPVILISIDTLRADHLGFWGYERDTSPNLDRLAEESVAFMNTTSQAPQTIPSLLQLMTGQYVQHEQVDPESTTLAELAKAHGYRTGAVVDNPIIELRPTGLQRGFDDFFANDVLDPDLDDQHWKTKMPAEVITSQGLRWLDSRPRAEESFFLWLHYFDPHDPYLPPFTADLPFAGNIRDTQWTGDIRRTFLFKSTRERLPFDERDRQHLIDLYDAEIRYVDRSLGELFAELERRGLYDASWIVVTSDHGEAFGEHGQWTHGRSVFQEEIHVPLLFKPPRRRAPPRRITAPAETIDILPTLARLVGFDTPSDVDGRDLFAEPPERAHLLWRDWVVVRTERFKLIANEHTDRSLLFDLVEDPFETRDVSKSEEEVFRRLVEEKEAWIHSLRISAEEARRLSREEVEQLRSLGYL